MVKNNVLVVGVYLIDKPNYAEKITHSLMQTRRWNLDIHWAAIGQGVLPDVMKPFTRFKTSQKIQKFVLINRLLASVDMDQYRYVLVTDDDIELPDGFLDRYLACQEMYDLALAQPARTHDSFVDHRFVSQLLGVAARRTRFVEIGPVFSIRHDAFSTLIPFEEGAPMGWGLDFIWPLLLEAVGMNLGIIDMTPVKHRLRKSVSFYNHGQTEFAMKRFLKQREHLTPSEVFVALQTFPLVENSPQGNEGQ